MNPHERVAYLFGSANRPALLRALRERSRGPSALADDCGVSRATVHRSLAGFRERDWVRRDGHTYETTLAGDLVLERYESLLETARLIDGASELLRTLDERASGLTAEMLDDATVVTTEPDRPHAPLEFYRDHLDAAEFDRCRSVVPSANSFYADVHESLVDREVETSVVVGRSTLEVAGRDHPTVAPADESERFDVVALDERPPFGLTIAGDHVLLGALDEDGHARAYLAAEDEPLREWGERKYTELAARAEPLQ